MLSIKSSFFLKKKKRYSYNDKHVKTTVKKKEENRTQRKKRKRKKGGEQKEKGGKNKEKRREERGGQRIGRVYKEHHYAQVTLVPYKFAHAHFVHGHKDAERAPLHGHLAAARKDGKEEDRE